MEAPQLARAAGELILHGHCIRVQKRNDRTPSGIRSIRVLGLGHEASIQASRVHLEGKLAAGQAQAVTGWRFHA